MRSLEAPRPQGARTRGLTNTRDWGDNALRIRILPHACPEKEGKMRKGLIRISVLWVTLPLLLPMTASTQGTPEQQARDGKQSASSEANQGGSNAKAEKEPSQ